MHDSFLSRTVSKTLKLCGVAAMLSLPVSEARASCGPGDSVYLGSVCVTAISFCPRGYMSMSGQIVAISENNALFSLLGCTWGGDCRSTFGIPDMRGRSPVGQGTGPGLTPYELGQYRGAETHTLTEAELAEHSHTATFTPLGASDVSVTAFDGNGAAPTPSAENSFLQTIGENPFAPNATANLYGTGTGNPVTLSGVEVTGGGGTVTVGNTGTARPFPIVSPVTALTYCIATEGIYPPRS
ncbi:tail fiber protein [Thalassobaculum sp.]|uniref:phage tail protein n=1 Tax=Thalassobaculum sp. TaxID=2022740 RepID=UPI0032EEABF0